MSSKRPTNIDALFGEVDIDALFEADDGKRPQSADMGRLLLRTNRAMLDKHGDQFTRIFHRTLGHFMHPFFGFDVFKFDDYINPPDGISLRDAVLARYGEGAMALIESLIEREASNE